MAFSAFAVLALCASLFAAPEVQVDEKAGTAAVPVTFAKQGEYDVLKGAIEYMTEESK